MSGGIFISYRRDDNRYAAGRFYDRLADHFGREKIFMDVDAIEPGLDFVEVLSQRVATCNVLVAIIGPQWLDIRDANGLRRLDDPNDFVRIELEAALSRGIRVVPVLVDGATIPREADLPPTLAPLARRNAVTLTHATFGRDVAALMTVLEKDVRPKRAGWLGKSPAALHQSGSSRPVSGSPGVGPASTFTGAGFDLYGWISWIGLGGPFGWSHIAVGAIVGIIGSFLPFSEASLLGFGLPFTGAKALKPDFGVLLGLSLVGWLCLRRSIRSVGGAIIVFVTVVASWWVWNAIYALPLMDQAMKYLGLAPFLVSMALMSSLALSLVFADYSGIMSWLGRNAIWAIVCWYVFTWVIAAPILFLLPKDWQGEVLLYSGPWLGSNIKIWSAGYLMTFIGTPTALFFWLIGRQADRQRPPHR